MRVEFVADMIRSAETADQETAILEAARRTGLQVEEVPAAELLGPELELEEGDFRSEIQKIFPRASTPSCGPLARQATWCWSWA